MGTLAKIVIATVIMGVVFLVSPRLFIIILLMTGSVAVATVVELGKDRFRGNIVLHKCCANVHWVFISFYILVFDKLHPIRKIEPWQFAAAAVGMSVVLYIFATVNVHRLLANANPPSVFTSKDERLSIIFATWSLALALGFAWLVR